MRTLLVLVEWKRYAIARRMAQAATDPKVADHYWAICQSIIDIRKKHGS